jgi:hypothetical protein
MFVHFHGDRENPASTWPAHCTECTTSLPEKENIMDFGLILFTTNTLMAIFIFFVLNLIWKQ